MNKYYFALKLLLFSAIGWISAYPLSAQDWLTPLELEKLREEEGGDKRIEFYIRAARLRMETARLRLAGKNSKPKDPLEFFSLTDLVGGCFQALRASMLNLEDQIQYKKIRGPQLTQGLKALRGGAKDLQPFFREMQKAALDRREESLHKIAVEGLTYADSALRGVEKALKKYDTDDPYLPLEK